MKSISQKGFSKIALIVVGVVLVLAIGGGVAYLWYVNNQDTRDKIQTNSNNQNSNTQTTAETTAKTTTKTTDETVDWQIYTNEKYGFSFKYPMNWKLVEDNLGTGKETSANQFLKISDTTASGKNASFVMWVNPVGFDMPYGKIHYKPVLVNGAIILSNRIINQSDSNSIFQPKDGFVEFELLSVRDNQYLFSGRNIVDENQIIQILSTFRFTP